MRDLTYLDSCRVDASWYYGSLGDAKNGAFKVFVGGRSFFVIASSGGGWEHVSVSPGGKKSRCPTWDEMRAIKDMFFEDEEAVMQALQPWEPVFAESLPLTLEEVFISEMEAAGYDIDNILS